MATIKSYTDLEQSRKLSEILPLESADMWYSIVDNEAFICLEHHNEYEQIPCWSLAALLGVLPTECECMALEHINYGNNHKKYFMHYVGGENTEDYVNAIDACYEMIMYLHKLNLL